MENIVPVEKVEIQEKVEGGIAPRRWIEMIKIHKTRAINGGRFVYSLQSGNDTAERGFRDGPVYIYNYSFPSPPQENFFGILKEDITKGPPQGRWPIYFNSIRRIRSRYCEATEHWSGPAENICQSLHLVRGAIESRPGSWRWKHLPRKRVPGQIRWPE